MSLKMRIKKLEKELSRYTVDVVLEKELKDWLRQNPDYHPFVQSQCLSCPDMPDELSKVYEARMLRAFKRRNLAVNFENLELVWSEMQFLD